MQDTFNRKGARGVVKPFYDVVSERKQPCVWISVEGGNILPSEFLVRATKRGMRGTQTDRAFVRYRGGLGYELPSSSY